MFCFFVFLKTNFTEVVFFHGGELSHKILQLQMHRVHTCRLLQAKTTQNIYANKVPPPPPQVLAYDIKSDTLAIHFSLVHNITDQDKDSWSRFHDLLNIGF